jgi:AcrR family transcriptional regulator
MPKDVIIAQLRDVFRRYGYEGSSLAKISAATGLGRASLYHYFPKGKEEMAATVLGHIAVELEEHLLKPLKGEGEPITRIQAMVKTLDQFYNCGHSSCFLDILSIGEAQTLFQSTIRQIVSAWINSLTEVLVEAGQEPKLARQRAEDAIIRIQGALVLCRCCENTAPFQQVLAKLPENLGL